MAFWRRSPLLLDRLIRNESSFPRFKSLTTTSASSTSKFGTNNVGPVDDDEDTRHLRHPEHSGPIVPYPKSPYRKVPPHIARPPYADTGRVPTPLFDSVTIHSPASISRMRDAARYARRALDYACSLATAGTTTDEIDAAVHEYITTSSGDDDSVAYPSPLNYAGFPKSLCASVNEVVCHGVPDGRPLRTGDVVSFDVSVFRNGVHGDNCATVVVGDDGGNDDDGRFARGRRLVAAAKESLAAAVDSCRPGSCLSDIGAAVEDVCDAYGYGTVRKYRGHGIGETFHSAPYVKHYRNSETLILKPGMIFTIEPMIVEGYHDCYEWASDGWTVVTRDGGWAAQFEHTVLIMEDGVEILTLP